ncbi:MAG: phosphoglycolate phosphatase [Desulfobacteraceae bacterium Eth-SRB2]|nr:MAG: phosphoglycolate phosphatase [Desulfobacteraceae bacterium Eth-SRB2]
MQYKAVLFDLDGTLIDTVDDIGDAANRVLSNRNFPTHSISTYRLFIGEGVRMLLTRALPEESRNQDLITACLKEFIEDYRYNYNIKTNLYDGVSELLDKLQKRGLKLAILSNKPHPMTKDCVAFFLSRWNFDVVLGQRDSIPRKPDPQGALEVAQKLAILPSNIIYLGDTAIDMKTALSAGMFPVGVLWGFRSLEELTENGARVVIDEPMQLMDFIT